MRKWSWLLVLAMGWLPGADVEVSDVSVSLEAESPRTALRTPGAGHVETGRSFLVWDEDADAARAWARELRDAEAEAASTEA